MSTLPEVSLAPSGSALSVFSSWSRCPGAARYTDTTYTESALLPADWSPMPMALANSGHAGPLTKVSVCQAYRSRTAGGVGPGVASTVALVPRCSITAKSQSTPSWWRRTR